MIKATGFKEIAKKFNFIKQGKVYLVYQMLVRQAYPKYKIADNPYELLLIENTIFKEYSNYEDFIPVNRFHFVPISKIKDLENSKSLINVIGVVLYSNLIYIRKYMIKDIKKRDLILLDNSN